MPLSFVVGNRTICCDTNCSVPPGFARFEFELIEDLSYVFGDPLNQSGLALVFGDEQCTTDCANADILTSDYADFNAFSEGVFEWLSDLAEQAGGGSLARMRVIPGGFVYILDANDAGWQAAFGGSPCNRQLKICVCEDANPPPPQPPSTPCPPDTGRFVVSFSGNPVAPPATLALFNLTHSGGECFDFSRVGDTGVTTGSTAQELATGFWNYVNGIAGVTAVIEGTTVTVSVPAALVQQCCGETPTIVYSDTGGNLYNPAVSVLECCPTCPDNIVLDAIWFGSNGIIQYLSQHGTLKIHSATTDFDVELYGTYGGIMYDNYGELSWNNTVVGNPALQAGTTGATPLELATNFTDFVNVHSGLGAGITAIQTGEYVNIVVDYPRIECPTVSPVDVTSQNGLNMQIRYVPGNSTGAPYLAGTGPTVLRTVYNSVRPPNTSDSCCACYDEGGPIQPGRARFRLVFGKKQIAANSPAFDDPANGIPRPYQWDGVWDGTNQFIQVPAGAVTGNDSLTLATAVTNYVNSNNGAGDLFDSWQAIIINTDVVFDVPCFECPTDPPYINPATGAPGGITRPQRTRFLDGNGDDIEIHATQFISIQRALSRTDGYITNTLMICCTNRQNPNPCDYGANYGIIEVRITGGISNPPVTIRGLSIRNDGGDECFGFTLNQSEQQESESFFPLELAQRLTTAFNRKTPIRWGAFSLATKVFLVLPLDSGCCGIGTTVSLDLVDSRGLTYNAYTFEPPNCCTPSLNPFQQLIIQNELFVCDCTQCINPDGYASVLLRNNGSDYLTVGLSCNQTLVINFPNLQAATSGVDGSEANEKLVQWISDNEYPDYFARTSGNLIRIFFPKDLIPDCDNCSWDWTIDSSNGVVEFLGVDCCGGGSQCPIPQDKAQLCIFIDYDALATLPFSDVSEDASFDLLFEAGGCTPARNAMTSLSGAANRQDYLNRVNSYMVNLAATYSGTVNRTGAHGQNFCLTVDKAAYQTATGNDICVQSAAVCDWTNIPYDPEGCYIVVPSFSLVAGLSYIPNRTEYFAVRFICPGDASGQFIPFERNNYSSEANLSTFLDKLVNDFNTNTPGYMIRVGTDDVQLVYPCSQAGDCSCIAGGTVSVQLFMVSPPGQPNGNWWRPTNSPVRCLGGYNPPPAPLIPVKITENWQCCPPEPTPEPPQNLNISILNGGISGCCTPDPPPPPQPRTPQLVGIVQPGLNPLCCPPFAVRLEILDCCCNKITSIDVSNLISREWLGVIRDPLQYIQVLELDPATIEGCFAVRLTSPRGATYTTECYKVEECINTVQLCGLYPEGTTDCEGRYYGEPDEICGEYFAYKNCIRIRGELIDNGFSISSEGDAPYLSKSSEFSYRLVTELLPPFMVRELHNIFMAPRVEIDGKVFEIPEVEIQQNIRENTMFALDIELTNEGCSINYSCIEIETENDED